jgi:branched-chain amino acid transport system permease protein
MTDDLQHLVNGLVSGSTYALLGASFALIFSVTGRFHFAYSLTYVVGPVITVMTMESGFPLWAGIACGLVASAVLGVLIELFVYRPIERGAGVNSLLSVAIASLAVTIIGENLINLNWSSQPARFIDGYTISLIKIGSIKITSLDLTTVIVAWVGVLGLAFMLRRTPFGRSIHAVRSEAAMSRLVGLNPGRVALYVFAIGSLLSAVLGTLAALKTAAAPDIGFDPLFFAFVVAFLAGPDRSPLRIGLVGLALGVVESLSTIWISGVWSTTFVFGILFVYFVIGAAQQREILGAR